MISHDSKIRVRYAETDQMGYVYYGNYATYYEIGRTELIRKCGISYKQLEEAGIMLPVSSLSVKYKRAAKYDELLTIRTTIEKLPNVRIQFLYEVYNEENQLLNDGEVTLIFVDSKTRRPKRAPDFLLAKIVHHCRCGFESYQQ